MSNTNKPQDDDSLKIVFAEGCFDDFEGTQEELDEMIAEIKEIFANSTPEELMSISRPVSDEEVAELGLEDSLLELKNKTGRNLH